MTKKEKDFESKYLSSNPITKLLVNNFYASIQKTIDKLEIKNALEVGCGAGFSTEHLKRVFTQKKLEASDLRTSLVKKAVKRNPLVKISQESAYSLKRENNSFDIIIMLEVLEHLTNPQRALQEAKRITTKYCLFSVPEEPLFRILNICRIKYLKDLGNTPGHIQHWSKKTFHELIKQYFNIIKIKKSLPWLIILAKK